MVGQLPVVSELDRQASDGRPEVFVPVRAVYFPAADAVDGDQGRGRGSGW